MALYWSESLQKSATGSFEPGHCPRCSERRTGYFSVKRLGNHSHGLATVQTSNFLQGICNVAGHIGKHHTPTVPFVVSTVLMPHSHVEHTMKAVLSNPRPRHFRRVRIVLSRGWQWELSSLICHETLLTSRNSSLIPHPSSLIPHPSSLIPHPSSLIPHPSSLIPHPSSLIPHPSSLIPHPSFLIPHPSSLIPHRPSCLYKQYSKLSTRAIQLASITFSLTPTVPHTSLSSWLSITTRTPAAVPASELIARTL